MTRSLLRMNSASSAANPASVSAVTRRLRAGAREDAQQNAAVVEPRAALCSPKNGRARCNNSGKVRTAAPASPPPRASSCSTATRAWRGTHPPRPPPRQPPRACAPCALRAKKMMGGRAREEKITKPGSARSGETRAAAEARTVSCRRHDARGLVLGLLQDRELRSTAPRHCVGGGGGMSRQEKTKQRNFHRAAVTIWK
jgi:hypothetical protein